MQRESDALRRMVRTHHKHGVDLIKVTGRLAPGYEADPIVTGGDPRARDYVPDSGRFDVSAPAPRSRPRSRAPIS